MPVELRIKDPDLTLDYKNFAFFVANVSIGIVSDCSMNICTISNNNYHQIGIKKINQSAEIFVSNNRQVCSGDFLELSCLKRFYSQDKKPFVILVHVINSDFQSINGSFLEPTTTNLIYLNSKFENSYSNGLIFKIIQSNQTFIYKQKLKASKSNKCFESNEGKCLCDDRCIPCNEENRRYLFIQGDDSSECDNKFSAYFGQRTIFDDLQVIDSFHNKQINQNSIEPISSFCIQFNQNNFLIKLLDEFNLVKNGNMKKNYFIFKIYRVINPKCNNADLAYMKLYSVNLELLIEEKVSYLISTIRFDNLDFSNKKHFLIEVEYHNFYGNQNWNKKLLAYFNFQHSGNCSIKYNFIFDSILNSIKSNKSFVPGFYFFYVDLNYNLKNLKFPFGFFECKNYLFPYYFVLIVSIFLTILILIVFLILKLKNSWKKISETSSCEIMLFYVSTRSGKNYEETIKIFCEHLSVILS